MSVFQYFKKKDTLIQELTYLRQQKNILANIGDADYDATEYQTYKDKVIQLSKMYDGEADWGNFIVKTIIDLRAAFIASSGINVEVDEKSGSREKEFVDELIKRNGLDNETPQAWAKEGEIEGKFLCRLFVDKEKKQIDVRYVPWVSKRYSVKVKDNDYAKYDAVEWQNGQAKEIVPEDEFVYVQFGGRTHYVNKTPSRTSAIIRQIENLDKAQEDWREINHLYAAPTPVFECKEAGDVSRLHTLLKDINWKIGKFIATTAKFQLHSVNAGSKDSLVSEITALTKIISGTTGIPPHFLGYPDLMSNRATASEMGDLITSSTATERVIWKGAYNQLLRKALLLANKHFKTGYKPDVVEATMPYITKDKLQELVDVWLPLEGRGIVDKDYIRSMIPDVDSEAMAEREAEAHAKLIQEMRARAEAKKEEEKDELIGASA